MKFSMTTAALLMAATTASAGTVHTIPYEDALCNDGTQATYIVEESNSNKWAVIIPGGGVARNPDEYRNRSQGFKTADTSDHGFDRGIERDLKNMGYNMVYIPYCSSDLWAGNHVNKIDGKDVQFRGRAIIEGVGKELYDELKNADEVVVAGYSAGAIGIGINADLIGMFGNARVLVDGFWFDNETKDFFKDWAKRNDRTFIYKALPKHCKGDWTECYPSRSNFERNNIDDVFLVWSVGDRYARPVDKKGLMQSTKSDIEFYDAGYSINAEKRRVSGFEDWGHVLAWDDKTYKKVYTEQSLQSAIKNWVNKSGDATVVDY